MGKLGDLLKDVPDSEKRYIKISTDLAAQISSYLREKGWCQADLANSLGKNESEVSKWLSGTHNFTVKTLALIESILEKDLFIIPLDINKKLSQFQYPIIKNTKTGSLNYLDILKLVNAFGYDITPKMDSYRVKKTTEGKSTRTKKIDSTHFITYNIS